MVQIVKKEHPRGSNERYFSSSTCKSRASRKPQKQFLLTLLPTLVLVFGKANFTNMSRYSDKDERTYRRQYSKNFNFTGLNAEMITIATALAQVLICVMDCSFIPKSGKHTPGLDHFYNGSASRNERGLEISVLAVVDVNARRGYSLSVQQTPATAKPLPKIAKTKKGGQRRISRGTIEELSQYFKTLLLEPKVTVPNPSVDEAEKTRVDGYLAQFQACVGLLPEKVKYLVVDGFYSKLKFVNGVVASQYHVIGKLRIDANLRYLYTGPQKPRGARRKYDGKVDLGNDMSRLTDLGELEPNLKLHTAIVWHVTLKRQIRLVYLVDQRRAGKQGVALLFSTDIDLDAKTLLSYYQARFQIEFIFRDAKQFTGLCDAQTRQVERLDYHFNASLTALNLAKYEDQSRQEHPQKPSEFSMNSIKRRAFNTYLLEQFIVMLGLDPTLIKSNPNFEELCSLGVISP